MNRINDSRPKIYSQYYGWYRIYYKNAKPSLVMIMAASLVSTLGTDQKSSRQKNIKLFSLYKFPIFHFISPFFLPGNIVSIITTLIAGFHYKTEFQMKISKNELEQYKNKNKYAIWIDDVNVSNEQLNKYKCS